MIVKILQHVSNRFSIVFGHLLVLPVLWKSLASEIAGAKIRSLSRATCLPSGRTSPTKKRQKETDARWAKKNGGSYYGYKDHLKVDNKYKLIQAYSPADASVHDSQALGDFSMGPTRGKPSTGTAPIRARNIGRQLPTTR